MGGLSYFVIYESLERKIVMTEDTESRKFKLFEKSVWVLVISFALVVIISLFANAIAGNKGNWVVVDKQLKYIWVVEDTRLYHDREIISFTDGHGRTVYIRGDCAYFELKDIKHLPNVVKELEGYGTNQSYQTESERDRE